MAVAFVAIGADATNNSGSVAIPAGSVDDFLIFVWESDNAGDAAAASGWTHVVGTYGSHRFGYSHKIATSAGATTQAFTGLNDSNFNQGFVSRYSGVNTAAPLNVVQALSTSATTGTITTLVDGCMELAFQSWDAGISSTSPPSGWTRRHDGNGGNWYSAERLKATAGATGTTAFSGPGGGIGQIHVALAPAATASYVRPKLIVPIGAVHRASRW